MYPKLFRTVTAIVSAIIWSIFFVHISQADSEPPARQSRNVLSSPSFAVGSFGIGVGVSSNPDQERPEDPPLHNAVRRNDWQGVQELIAANADINETNDQLSTPLTLAIDLGHNELAKNLISIGANVNLPDKQKTINFEDTPSANKQITGASSGGRASQGTRVARSRAISVTSIPRSPLSHAIQQKNPDLIFSLLEKGATCNELESRGHGPYYAYQMALLNELYDVTDKMLEQLIYEQLQQTVDSLLIWSVGSAEGNKMNIIKYLVDRGAAFETFNKEGYTPLMLAAMVGDIVIVTYLHNHGAIIDTPSNHHQYKGYTALMLAASRIGHSNSLTLPQTSVINYLIEQGADINLHGGDKKTTLHLLSSKNTPLQLIDISFAYGAKPNVLDALGYTPLNWALYSKRIDIAKLLIEKGADINIGINIIEYIQRDDFVAVDFYLDNHYDLNKEYKNTTPLIFVCANGKTEYVTKFIDAGADVNFVLSKGKTPLFAAIASGNLEIVKILVEAGADVKYKSKDGINSFVLANSIGQKEIAEYLKSHGADTEDWIQIH